MANLTTANSALTLQIDGLYPVPQSIQGYAVDEMFALDLIKKIETQMGVDGRLSGGRVNAPKIFHISLQGDSPSNEIFDQWEQAEEAGMTVLTCNLVLTAPSLGKKFVLTKGFFTEMNLISDAKKLFQPRKFTIEFEKFSGAPA